MLARRYGKLPSQLLTLDVTDYQFNQFISNVAVSDEIKRAEKQAQRVKRNGR